MKFRSMKFRLKDRLFSSAVIVALAGVLIVLAVLQYRWGREVSEATSVRMQAGLHGSMMNVRQDLYHELASAGVALQPDSSADLVGVVQRLEEWSRTAPHANLVQNVFIWQGSAGKPAKLLRLDVAGQQFVDAEWPSEFGNLRDRLESIAAEFPKIDAVRRPEESSRKHDDGASPRDREDRARRGFLFRLQDRAVFSARANRFWQLDQNIPALVHPLFHQSASMPEASGNHAVQWEKRTDAKASASSSASSSKSQGPDWMIVQINRKYLQDTILPELIARYFGGADGATYQVALLGGDTPERIIYSTSPQFGAKDTSAADATLNMFGPPRDRSTQPAGVFFYRPGGPRPDGAPARHPGDPGFAGLPLIEPLHYSDGEKDWQLIARNSKGSLESVVAGLRRRNMAISFGVLLLLAASMAMIVIASQRAQRLARLQMDFVAAVSHELRTPLAVICSAAENIADGVVNGKQQLAKYRTVIKDQGRQLNQLIEQVLLFASTSQSHTSYNLRPLQVSEVLNAALENTAGVVQSAHVQVERNIEPDLPQIVGDLSAMSQCLQNLITNAVKYGGQSRWMGVRAHLAKGKHGNEVQISVEDRGLGIEPSEIGRIFEPFYRSPAVAEAQIHGTGLGLALAKSIAEAIGGRLTVVSAPGKGSCFTLHMPVAAHVPSEEGVAVPSVVKPRYS